MNRTEFEALRDIPGKLIRQDIRFSRRGALRPVLVAEDVIIENSEGVDLRMNLSLNPETGSKTVNVYIRGTGPICRIDVDGTRHGDAGRSHKHALQSERCPDRNLPDDVGPRPELSTGTIKSVFEELCKIASIACQGTFYPPDEEVQP